MSDNKTFSMPRVIFADERDESLIPPGVIMAIALQQAGYKIKPFVVGIDEHMTALLHVLFGERATVLDSLLLENIHRLKQLFVTAAREDHLNILFAPLGSCSEEKIKVNPVLESVAEQLKCPIIPVFFSSGSSAITARRVLEFARQLPNSISNLIKAVSSALVKGELLIEGGSSPIFGESFFLPNGDQIRGLSFFPFKGYYAESSGPCHKVNIDHISSEKRTGKSLSGYWPTWVKLEVKSFNCMPTWTVKQEGSQAPIEDGWVYGNASAFAVKPEFWSNPEIMLKMFS